MDGDVDIAAVGHLVADPARARMLVALADPSATLPAGVLAEEAGIAPSTASVHLAKLVDGGLLAVEARGRHRHYRLAGAEVGALMEALARLAPPLPVRSLRDGNRASAVRYGRHCFDHLAGTIGTELMAGLLTRRVLVADPDGAGFRLTGGGARRLTDFGLDVEGLRGRRRPLVRHCTDWSEGRPHLGGALGAALAARLDTLGWIIDAAPGSRAVRATDAGRAGLAEAFGVRLPRSGDVDGARR